VQALAERGDVGQGLHWMLESLKSLPEDATDLQRVVRTNLAAWDGRLISLERVLSHPGRVGAVVFSPDGRMIVTCCYDGRVRRWDAVTGQMIGTPLHHPGLADAVVFSPDGKTFATFSNHADTGRFGAEQVVRQWDAATGRPVGKPLVSGADLWSVGYSPDGKVITTGSGMTTGDQCEARFWNATTGELVGAPLKHG
jgi:WD40 repeat protein